MIELINRKNTTEKALESLESFRKSFSFYDDIQDLESETFSCKGDVGSDINYVWSNYAYWRIKDGELDLIGMVQDEYYPELADNNILPISRIRKIDFKQALSVFYDMIKKYNKLCQQKDSEIQEFLNFVQAYQNK